MKMKMKNRSRRYKVNRPRSGPGLKYKNYLSMMMLISIKQDLSKVWSPVHEKVKQHWDWVEKKCCL